MDHEFIDHGVFCCFWYEMQLLAGVVVSMTAYYLNSPVHGRLAEYGCVQVTHEERKSDIQKSQPGQAKLVVN